MLILDVDFLNYWTWKVGLCSLDSHAHLLVIDTLPTTRSERMRT